MTGIDGVHTIIDVIDIMGVWSAVCCSVLCVADWGGLNNVVGMLNVVCSM